MAVVSVAIVLSFHLKNQPTDLERRFALPVGVVFWVLSLACLANGLANYLVTVRKYADRRALVQSGWKTQIVSRHLFCPFFDFGMDWMRAAFGALPIAFLVWNHAGILLMRCIDIYHCRRHHRGCVHFVPIDQS